MVSGSEGEHKRLIIWRAINFTLMEETTKA
jgi:hypothetical protein